MSENSEESGTDRRGRNIQSSDPTAGRSRDVSAARAAELQRSDGETGRAGRLNATARVASSIPSDGSRRRPIRPIQFWLLALALAYVPLVALHTDRFTNWLDYNAVLFASESIVMLFLAHSIFNTLGVIAYGNTVKDHLRQCSLFVFILSVFSFIAIAFSVVETERTIFNNTAFYAFAMAVACAAIVLRYTAEVLEGRS